MTNTHSDQSKTAGPDEIFPVLPLRDIVVFPYMIVPLFVGREKSINALDEVMRTDRQILLAAQKNAGDDDPEPGAIYTMGTLATVLQLLKLPDGTVKVLVEGTTRAKIKRFSPNELYFEAEVERVEETLGNQDEIEAFSRSAVSQFENYVKLNKKISPEVLSTLSQIDDYSKLADTIASHLAIKIGDKQEILELLSVSDRLERVFTLMESEISVLQVERKIRSRVKRQMEKTQREYYLNEQMKAIQKELGDSDERDDISEFEEKIENTKLSKEAKDKAVAELKKLKQMSPMSAEATVVRNYLDWILSPLTCRLQEARPRAACALAALTAHVIALTALAALGLSRAPFHAGGRQRSMTVTERSDRKPSQLHLNLTTWSNRTVGQDRTGHRLGPLRCRRAQRRRWCSRGRGRFKGLNEGSTQPWSWPRNEANSDRGTNA